MFGPIQGAVGTGDELFQRLFALQHGQAKAGGDVQVFAVERDAAVFGQLADFLAQFACLLGAGVDVDGQRPLGDPPAVPQDEQLRRYSMIAWDRRKRIQDQSNVVAEWLFGEALDYWHPYMIQFRVLLRRMALPDMLPICDTVLSKAHVQTREHRFRYFMKVAYAELYGDTERPPMPQPTTDQQGSNPDDIPV